MELPTLVRQGGELSAVSSIDQGTALLFCQREHQLQDLLTIVIIEVAGRFVRQEEARAAQERPTNSHTLHLSPTELMNRSPGSIGQIHSLQEGLYPGSEL